MNPNVTYASYGHTNRSHSPNRSHGHGGMYRVNPSIHSTLNMDAASVTTNNNNFNTNAATGAGTTAAYAGTIGAGTVGGVPTRNSYLSYASTPSWANPSTMMETPARTPRPLPDPQTHGHSQMRGGHGFGHGQVGSVDSRGYASSQQQQQQYYQQQGYGGQDYGGQDYGQGQGQDYGHGQGHHEQGHGRPPSGGFYITNVAEVEEVEEGEYEDGPQEGEHEGEHEGGYEYQHPYQNGFGGVQGQNGYSMPVGMGGMGVPMERVAAPLQQQRRPLPIPGVTQGLRRNGTLRSSLDGAGSGSKKKSSFVGGFFLGLKRLPKTVLRYGSKKDKKKRREEEEFESEDMFGGGFTGGLTAMHTGGTLPQYASNPATPTAGPVKNRTPPPQPTMDDSIMPGALPMSPPPDEARRHRGPSLRVTPPSGETLNQINPEEHQYFQSPEQEEVNPPPPPPGVEYPPPSTERNRTTVMMYHDEPQQETNMRQETSRPSTETSERPGTVRQTESGSLSRMASNHTSQNLSNAGRGPNAINTTVSPPGNGQSPVTAHPLPANDYMKMTTSPRTATHATEVTEYTSYTDDPSFSSELNPVFRFFHGFYHLPWISERSTVDYSPMAGFGGKSGGRGIMKKPGLSWYRRKGETQGLTSNSLDLLSTGDGDTGSVLSPLGGWRRRVRRRNTGDNGGRRHRHHHRHHSSRHGHGHGHGHGGSRGRRYRRRSTSTITFEEYHHQRNPSPMIPSTYPFPFVSPPFPYFQAFPAPAAVGESPAQPNTSTAANQGTPGPGNGDRREGGTQTETARPAPVAESTPRGPRGAWGGRAAMYPHGYAAYPPSSSPVYPAPVWMTTAEGGEGSPGRRHGGVVYMPIVPGGYV
ncbi:hypothetical protein P691DRAFT_427200 [Macrolepiota fuliginosa MF-IS2]|uniref:Uncharacterized protein n=1 Tax=Macrolepiota fuliginosa MF-IS2 TaxID=1400762 RepID=A0A9P5X3Y6_9AGAR|nr:hypothetical protein P691DRAFT_427200 [Macrolepiota fuliginosa MF-IS2]